MRKQAIKLSHGAFIYPPETLGTGKLQRGWGLFFWKTI